LIAILWLVNDRRQQIHTTGVRLLPLSDVFVIVPTECGDTSVIPELGSSIAPAAVLLLRFNSMYIKEVAMTTTSPLPCSQ
jgi:hypothetical protein